MKGKDIVRIKNVICKIFTYDNWMDIGYITNEEKVIKGHHRLLQSVQFQDDDYERNALEVIKEIIDKDENNANEIISYIRDSYPDSMPYIIDFIPEKISNASHSIYKKSMKDSNQNEELEMDIFISHSNQDAHVAKLLIDLIRTAFNVPAKRIRCTSVDGYRLSAGASTDEQLKREVHESKVLIVLVSPSSMDSTYVLFELGARWATSLPLIPLVTSKLGTQLLKGPLSGINALNISNISQVHQLVNDLGRFLQIESESAAVYQEKADTLIEFTLKDILPDISRGGGASINDTIQEVDSIDSSIKSYCENQWPDDYTMRVHCMREQKEANAKLKEMKPDDIPELIFKGIIRKASHEWPDDYTMQVHSRDEQISAYRELQKM